MRQLSGIDVSFLNMETPTTYGHVSSLNIYDPKGVPGGAGVEAMKRILLERMEHLAPFRRRLVEVPFGLDLPYWVEDPDFDIDFHVRGHAIASPGTEEQLADAICRIHGRPMDRSRPLWELYVIEGYKGGKYIAQFTKVHHATIDGAAGALMLATMLDTDPQARPGQQPLFEWDPEPVPSDAELLRLTLREFVRRPEKAARMTMKAARDVAAATRNGGLRLLVSSVAQPIPGPLGDWMRARLRGPDDPDQPPALPGTPAPRTPFNAVIGSHRRFAFTTVPLDEARQIRRATGATFNDVVMALCSGALRRYLIEKDALPAAPLLAMVPVSVRTGSEDDLFQNRVSALIANLATDEADPLRRLDKIRASMTRAKSDMKAIPAESLMDFAEFAPPAIAARALRMASRLRIADRTNPPFNVVISNVPGPPFPLYSAGAELRHFYPVSALVDGQGLNMTVQSYNGNLDFGFIADRELVPDVWHMTELLHDAHRELLDAIDQLTRSGDAASTIPDTIASAGPARAKKTTGAKKTGAKTAPSTTTPAKRTGARTTRAAKAGAGRASARAPSTGGGRRSSTRRGR